MKFETDVVGNEVLSPQILLGKQLFFDARDKRLASQSYIRCAVCHEEGGHDGSVWDFTDAGEGLRNTTNLRGRRGNGHGRVHWSANFDEIHDFENDIRGAFGGTGLLDDTTFEAVEPTLGAPKAGLSPDLDALAAFVTSLATFGDSPYRNQNGSLTAEAEAGRAVFRLQNCASCHKGKDFTDSSENKFHNIGTINSDSGQRLGGLLPGIDTPTLRGLWHGAPYLHNGSAATVAEAIEAHEGFTLTPAEVTQLEAYLLQIDDAEISAPQYGNTAPHIMASLPPQTLKLGEPVAIDLPIMDP